MLQNAYFLAKIGADTAENEQHLAEILPKIGRSAHNAWFGKITLNYQNFAIFFANFWRARSRLYQNKILQENMRLGAFFKIYKICILLHRCNRKVLAKKKSI